MDWGRLQSPSIEAVRRGVKRDTIFKEEGVYDSWTTPECPHLYFEKSRIDSYGMIIMKQGQICKMFAHDYPEPILEHIVVDVEGKFQVIFKVDSNNVQLVPKVTDVVSDCPYLKILSDKIRVQDIKKVVCVMIAGISEYSTPNLVVLYEVQDPPEDTAPWHIEVYEQRGEGLQSVLEAQSPLTRVDANIALYKDGSVCLLNEFGSCRLAGLITHSPPRDGYTNESGYKIVWKP
ncbi:hypothetical protein KBB12_03485 [Candidatus Woesebacteria bacterium]|nr:hypothetical protein [Candidatus Woesebacteria bacterium]